MAAKNKSDYPCIYSFFYPTTSIQLTCTRSRETRLNFLETLDAPIHRRTSLHKVLQCLLLSAIYAFQYE